MFVGWIIVIFAVLIIIVSIIILETTSSRVLPIVAIVFGALFLIFGLLFAFAAESSSRALNFISENPELIKAIPLAI